MRAERSRKGSSMPRVLNTRAGRIQKQVPGSYPWFRPRHLEQARPSAPSPERSVCKPCYCLLSATGTACPGVLNLTLTFFLPMAPYLSIQNPFFSQMDTNNGLKVQWKRQSWLLKQPCPFSLSFSHFLVQMILTGRMSFGR